ncbi:MAG: hypothetical protein KGL46_08310 [Hyphomicrobiales bacterium]|nr:hypothetical protein [Hyphomicrobiales bacterium]
MRKPVRAFTVEVKKTHTRKPFDVTLPASTPQPQAEAFFAPPGAAAAPAPQGEARRVLPCLVSQAAVEEARQREIEEAATRAAPRPVGRPRKPKIDDDAPAPKGRKRGRPPKQPMSDATRIAQVALVDAPVALSDAAIDSVAAALRDRGAARAEAAQNLPRSERWKRRLPRAAW